MPRAARCLPGSAVRKRLGPGHKALGNLRKYCRGERLVPLAGRGASNAPGPRFSLFLRQLWRRAPPHLPRWPVGTHPRDHGQSPVGLVLFVRWHLRPEQRAGGRAEARPERTFRLSSYMANPCSRSTSGSCTWKPSPPAVGCTTGRSGRTGTGTFTRCSCCSTVASQCVLTLGSLS